MPHTGWGSEARQQVEFQPAVFWLPIYSITAVLSVWLPLLLSLLPLAPPPPLPLKGTLLRWTVCVTRWAGHTQWDTQLSGCPCVYTCVSVFAVSTLGSLSSLHMKMYFKWCVLSPLSLHTHTNMNTVITSQWSSSAGSRERRWSCRLMDMFVYLFVLDMINWSAG